MSLHSSGLCVQCPDSSCLLTCSVTYFCYCDNKGKDKIYTHVHQIITSRVLLTDMSSQKIKYTNNDIPEDEKSSTQLICDSSLLTVLIVLAL